MAIALIRFKKKDARKLTAPSLKAVQAAMARAGAVRVGELFPRPLLKRIAAEVLRRHESGELKKHGLVRDTGGRYAAVLPLEGPLLDPRFYANPRVHQIVAALLGADYCIGSVETVIAVPGAVGQHQHIDGPIRFDRVVGKSREGYRGNLSDLPPYAVTVAIPLCDVTEENGPTAIWPGSHRVALTARPPGGREIGRRYREERVTARFGEAFLFDYRVFHGGTPNMSREPRALLMFVFVRRWFRDPNLNEIGPRVVLSPRDLARVPERHRALFMLAPAARRALWTRKKLR